MLDLRAIKLLTTLAEPSLEILSAELNKLSSDLVAGEAKSCPYYLFMEPIMLDTSIPLFKK